MAAKRLSSRTVLVIALACSSMPWRTPVAASPIPGADRLIASNGAPGMLRGVALGHYAHISPTDIDQRMREIKALGATHVSIPVVWSTPNVRSSTIAPSKGRTVADRLLLRMMDRASSLGLRVMLLPILDVRRRRPLEWRGTLKPDDWKRWWSQYRQFILHYARLAQRGSAQMFCVGSELVSTEGMRSRWANVIAEVRRVFPGKLIYSANWDHYQPVSFWDLVDVVGITGYYQLASTPDAKREVMITSWRQVRRKLVAWAKRLGRSFVFTEVGYPSLDGGAVSPWDYTKRTSANLEEQLRAYEAFVDVWAAEPRLAGVFFWDWSGTGGPNDTSYTPRHKPAQRVVERLFASSRPRTLSP